MYDQDMNFDCTPKSLKKIMNFLKLAVETNNLHVLRTVWIYGIETYFQYKPWESIDILMFVADLIRNNEVPYKILNFFIKQLQMDKYYCLIKANGNSNPYSGLKRLLIFGNLLCVAVYSNNIDAINLLLPKQQERQLSFEEIIENLNLENLAEYKNRSFNNNFLYLSDYNNRHETLFTNNPVIYAFDNGNVEAFQILIEHGYKIDFTAPDFSYQISNFAHKDTINYLIKNYKSKLIDHLKIKDILEASNYPLLRFYTKHKQLRPYDFNSIFYINDNFQFKESYRKTTLYSRKKCVQEFAKQGIKISDIEIALRFSLNAKDIELLDLCMSLYSSNNDYINITSLLPYTYFTKELLEYLSNKTKLVCYVDEIDEAPLLGIRDLQNYLKFIEFKFNDLSTLSSIATHILSKNSVTGIKLLIKNNFITSENYSKAVDYIIGNDLDKLITTLVKHSKELGGFKREYYV